MNDNLPITERIQHLSRQELRRIILSVPGSKTEVARVLNTYPAVVTQWLTNRFASKRVEAAVRDKATEILLQQEHNQAK